MITLNQIRMDLKEVRYYYSKQEMFDKLFSNSQDYDLRKKVNRYTEALTKAPARLIDLYVAIYVQNNSIISVSFDWDYSYDWMKKLHNELLLFLQKELKD